LVLPAGAEAFSLLHHHRRQPSSARAVQVVVAQGVSELTSIFITTSKVLLSSTVA
jgi:hypothetical protein